MSRLGAIRLVGWLPWILLVLMVAAWLAGGIWDGRSEEVTKPSDWAWGASFLAFPLVGLILALRLPRNAIGWLFLIGPALAGLGVTMMEYSEANGDPTVGAIGDSVFAVGLVLVGSALLLFPDGHYANRWFRWAHIVVVGGQIVITNEVIDGLLLGAFLVLVPASLILRAVKGDSTTRRQMTPPLLAGVGGVVLAFVGGLILPEDAGLLTEWGEVVISMIITIGVPVSIAISVTRYRLYEIDRVVSRTVTYALVIGAIGGVVILLATVIGTRFDSPPVVAAITLGVAAVFNPLRRRVQRSVDRRFNRSRYDAERVLGAFASTLRDQTDGDGLVEGWVGVVSTSMHPSSVGVWVRR